jgi:hypothetical protein
VGVCPISISCGRFNSPLEIRNRYAMLFRTFDILELHTYINLYTDVFAGDLLVPVACQPHS